MARIPRNLIVDDNATVHITWQAHNKSWFLHENDMKQLYYDLLKKYKSKYEIKIYSYSFMSSHPHLTVSAKTYIQLGDFFKVVNSCFAKKYNKLNGRKGQVVCDRYKSPTIKTDDDHVKVVIYGDFNQVRAMMVRHPREWKWSSYGYYARGKKDELIDDAPFYTNLGKTEKERQLKYRQLVNDILRNECLRKQNYSSVYFIGDPTWVQKRLVDLRDELREVFRKNQRSNLKIRAPG